MTPNAQIIPYKMDPSEVLDFKVDCTNLLEVDETIASHTVVLPAESALYGLTLNSQSITGNIITFWLSFTAFDGISAILPVEVTITTSVARVKQRTIGIQVDQL